MFSQKFGIEIEMTGITRSEAARVTAEYLGGMVTSTGDSYDTKTVTAPDGRVWKLMSDASIDCRRRQNRQKVSAGKDYSVELVSPILTYREPLSSTGSRSPPGFATLIVTLCFSPIFASPSRRNGCPSTDNPKMSLNRTPYFS
jgi:hypothetical protein